MRETVYLALKRQALFLGPLRGGERSGWVAFPETESEPSPSEASESSPAARDPTTQVFQPSPQSSLSAAAKLFPALRSSVSEARTTRSSRRNQWIQRRTQWVPRRTHWVFVQIQWVFGYLLGSVPDPLVPAPDPVVSQADPVVSRGLRSGSAPDPLGCGEEMEVQVPDASVRATVSTASAG